MTAKDESWVGKWPEGKQWHQVLTKGKPGDVKLDDFFGDNPNGLLPPFMKIYCKLFQKIIDPNVRLENKKLKNASNLTAHGFPGIQSGLQSS